MFTAHVNMDWHHSAMTGFGTTAARCGPHLFIVDFIVKVEHQKDSLGNDRKVEWCLSTVTTGDL